MGFLIAQSAAEARPKRKKPRITSNQKWMALAPIIKKRYKTHWNVKEIAAELALAEYKKNKKDWKRFSEEIG